MSNGEQFRERARLAPDELRSGKDETGHLQKRWLNRRQADSLRQVEDGGSAWLGNPGFFAIDERLRELSSKGDDLERLKRLVDFELFRAELEEVFLARIDARVGGRRSIMC